ncbi:10228_t:CDS:2, partial [Acaulospora morrowiae]
SALLNVFVKFKLPSYKASLTDDEFSEAFVHGREIRENLFENQIPLEVCRYIVVSENSKFLGRLPSIVNHGINLYDPLPPPDGTNPYTEQVANMNNPNSGNIFEIDLQRFLGRMPNANVQLLAERINQIADATNLQAAADRLIEMLAGLRTDDGNEETAVNNQNPVPNMPGGFPQESNDGEDELRNGGNGEPPQEDRNE